MKKLYTYSHFLMHNNLIKLLCIAVFILGSISNTYSQVRVPFTPRASQATPTQTIYNIKGDFAMLGNTNMTLVNYDPTDPDQTNDGDMEYVDIDGDSNTLNSSSATLQLSTENGAIPDCSNIIYAGLYWVGRADSGSDANADGDNNPNTFQVTKNGVTKNYDKQKVYLKGPSSASYTEITANSTDIYFPTNIDSNIFSAYAEVTDYVKNNGLGEYFVADIALTEGTIDIIGYSGGWGMVVIYENPNMKWRDITVFDGHAYVRGQTPEEYTIDINGFQAAPSGDVNLKLGFMASEGELGWTSDYFEIETQNTGTYQRLANNSGFTDNFFTSSILTGGNARNPNLVNNTGVDIFTLDVPNPGNSIIANGQTSTSFNYGSNEDTYAIFNLTFAVDAYVPEPEGVLTNTTINGNPPGPTNDMLEPDESANYIIEIKNTGTEALDNTVLTIPLPLSVNPSGLSIVTNTYPPFSTGNTPVYNSSIGVNGAIVWDMGTLPVPTDPDTVLADISFTLTVTTDCSILGDVNFDPTVTLDGTLSGVGAVSGVSFTTALIQGYETTGLCTGDPIPVPHVIDIDYEDYVNEAPVITAPSPINIDGCDENDITALAARYPYSATESADIKDTYVTTGYTASDNGTIVSITYIDVITPNTDCPLEVERTFTATDDCGNSTNATQIITIIHIAAPIVPDDGSETVECLDDAVQPTAPVVTDACDNEIIPVITENTDPDCEGDKIYTFTYTDCAGNAAVYTYTYTIDLTPFILPANGIQTVDNLADAVEPTPPTVNDNCNNEIIPTGPTVSDTPDCQGSIVYTFTYTDCAGNSADWTYTYTIELAPFTTPDDDGSTVECIDNAVAPTPPVVNDANGDPITPVMTENTDPDCEGDKIYTFTYTDCAGNSDTWVYTYTIDLTTAPVVPNDGSETVECLNDAVQPTAPVVTDACDNEIIPVITENTDPDCEGDKIYTFTYTDCAGNAAVYTYTYTIDLTTAPVVPDDGSETVECLNDAVQPTAPVVTDACGNNLTASDPVVTDTPNPASCEITRAYVFTYTDCAGNVSEYTFTYNIIDTTPPDLTLPANVFPECSVGDFSPTAFGTATATDNCDTNPGITFEDERVDGACEGTFEIRRTWTAEDACGNTTSGVQIISASDQQAPQFDQTNLPQDMEVECSSVPDAVTLTATDNCGNATVTYEENREDGNCPNNYIITRTWTAIDDCGLTNTHVQKITVQDITPPDFVGTLPPSTLVVECDSVPDAETLEATDACGSAVVSVEDEIVDGTCVNDYRILRTWTAEDQCGLKTSHTQTIIVQDTKAPEFISELPENTTVQCDEIPDTETLEAMDNCGDAVVTTQDVRIDGDCPSNYQIARTWIATDECGLTTMHTQIITVQDTKGPTTTTTFEETIDVSCTDIPDAPELEFTDNCSSDLTVVFNETSTYEENVFLDYEIVRTWTVRDECNNESVFTQTLNVALDEIITDIVAPDWCFDEGVVNMNDLLPDELNTDGTWEMLEGDTAATLNGNIFDPTTLELSLDFLPEDGGIDYRFRYTTTNEGCISITEITMNVHADCVVLPCGEKDVVISKAITPNGDAYNETFEINGIELCGFEYAVKIFNRWGALVFESDDYQNNWNGASSKSSIGNAGKVPNGTYYYIITIKDSGLPPFTGPVYIGTK
ncbi:gliding motility-associated C-terminal domain-containing protein [Seonamhaeicola sp.]|uniref:gliding motility-associated C-terminal domain-containing protein n=1 Tax=Seonamhaeicola sp. TaxID=1912245 RepID=UPI002623B016|nr:gliding motility-associated C-terminal domain-containing protein [Seonamhaeicola sp.]